MSDHIVLRHGPDIPDEYRAKHLEGRWYDAETVPTSPRFGPGSGPALAVAEPTGRFEVRESDGAVAEVYEIRLTTPNEQRADSPDSRVEWLPRPLPVLDHEHEWVDTTVLEDDERVEICAAGGCSATRTVPL